MNHKELKHLNFMIIRNLKAFKDLKSPAASPLLATRWSNGASEDIIAPPAGEKPPTHCVCVCVEAHVSVKYVNIRVNT